MLERDFKTAQRDNDRYDEQLRDSQIKLSLLRDKYSDLQSECERLESEKRAIKTEFERYQLNS